MRSISWRETGLLTSRFPGMPGNFSDEWPRHERHRNKACFKLGDQPRGFYIFAYIQITGALIAGSVPHATLHNSESSVHVRYCLCGRCGQGSSGLNPGVTAPSWSNGAALFRYSAGSAPPSGRGDDRIRRGQAG